jgi:GTPase SAR1 family protein
MKAQDNHAKKKPKTSRKRSEITKRFEKNDENFFSNNEKNSHFHDLAYSITSQYTMTIRENSLEEREKLEEEALSNNLHNLNHSYKQKDTNKFLNSLTSLSKDTNFNFYNKHYFNENNLTRPFSFNSIDNFNFDFNVINNNSQSYSNVSTNEAENEAIVSEIIMQNLEIFEDVIKVMVIGDKCSGKSLLVSKLLSRGKMNYIPTKNLEIYNRLFKHFGRFIRLELFDTCAKILSDSLMKIYYKLSHGFILICNEEISSVKFVEAQVEYIMNSYGLDKKIMIVCNERKKCGNNVVNDNLYHNYLKQISENFDVKVCFMDINEISIDDIAFEKFFNQILINKNKENSFKGKQNHVKKKLARVNSTSELTESFQEIGIENIQFKHKETSHNSSKRDCTIL